MTDRVLLVDDEAFILKALERLLRRAGYEVVTAGSANRALELMVEKPCQVVISDYRMPEIDGGVLLKEIKKSFPHVIGMMLSGYADLNAVIDLLNSGSVYRFIQKPWDDESLLLEVRNAFKHYNAVRAEQIRSQFLMSCADPILEINSFGIIRRSNAAMQQFSQYSASQLANKSLTWVFSTLTEHDVQQILTRATSAVSFHSTDKELELQVQKDDNDYLLLKLLVINQQQPLTNTINFPTVLDQANLLREMEQRLLMQKNYAAVSFQLRDFNLITDIIGIRLAEQAFEQIAATLLESMQDFGRLAYLAYEQFVMVFDKFSSEADLHQNLLTIIEKVEGRKLLQGKLVQLTFSVAYVLAPEDGESAKALLNNLLLTSRLNYSGRSDFFMRYSPSVTETRKRYYQLSEALYNAIDNEELSLVFQPKYHVQSGHVVAAEVLLRWNSKDFGTVPPSVFIPIAEQDGQIGELGAWVLRRACLYLMEWKKAHLPILPLAVNLSLVQLQQPDFITDTLAMLERKNITPEEIELEITESAVMDDLAASTEKIRELRAAGFKLSIDDFGTGYSSLAYLTRIPADYLKVDKALISDIEGNLNTQSMLQNMVRMAHDLGQQVIVEGVETEEQLQLLKQFNCDQAQGFLLCRPLSAEGYIELLEKHASYDEEE